MNDCVVEDNFLGEEISSDGGFILVRKLLLHVPVEELRIKFIKNESGTANSVFYGLTGSIEKSSLLYKCKNERN